MRSRLLKLPPVWIPVAIAAGVCLLRGVLHHFPSHDFLEPLELATYDWRAKLALSHPGPVAPNLGVIYVDEDSLAALNSPELGRYRWPWPRSVFGRVVHELQAQGALVVGMDLFFLELDRDYAENRVDGLSSDEFFARQLAASGNVVLGDTAENVVRQAVYLHPLPDLFRTNAWAVGHDGIRGHGELDRGVFRQVPAFVDDPRDGHRIWHLGLVLAARALGLDLRHARVEPGRIVLTAPGGLRRVIPVDAQHQFYVDWQIGPASDAVRQAPFVDFYRASLDREHGRPVSSQMAGRLVVIGFAAQGQNFNDWGPTPVGEQTPLCLSHMNVANSLLTGRFIQRSGLGTELLLLAGLMFAPVLAGFRLRLVTLGFVIGTVLAVSYVALAVWLYRAHRYWLPMVWPLTGSVLMAYVCLPTYWFVLERRERRRVRRVFGNVVSDKVINHLLQTPATPTRRSVTIYFADVRGFTPFVEGNNTRTLAQLRAQGLTGAAAEAVIDRNARETLETVNLYIGKVAELVKACDGTLDKYIGDCVMSFWGAPINQDDHAVACVKAALAVHRAMHALNQERRAENARRQRARDARGADGDPALEPLPILRFGSAINSGVATVGLMGSTAHLSNYTVFGRDVIIASRLVRGVRADCILATESTYLEVQRRAPELARTFIKSSAVAVAGIPEPVPTYEVPWEPPHGPPG